MAAAFQGFGAATAISSTNAFDSKRLLISSRRSLSERKASFLVVRSDANSKGRRNDQLVAKAVATKADSATASTASKPGGIHANFSAFRHREEIKVPIVPYGGATSVEGYTLSPHGGVCIDMTLMKSVKSLHLKDMDVVVDPGIGWIELNEYLEPYGLFFPLDPGPRATIGGMCATCCSGSLAVRYGTMRDNVISLKVVLANGDIVKTGSRARKSAAGCR